MKRLPLLSLLFAVLPLLQSCSNNSSPVATQPTYPWVAQVARLEPDPDLLAVYWEANRGADAEFWAGGTGSIAMRSDNGADWELISSGGNGDVLGFASTPTGRYELESGGIINWDEDNENGWTGGLGDLVAIATDGQTVIAVGRNGRFVTFQSKSDIQPHDTEPLSDFTDVIWSGSAFIASDADGMIYSYDGYSWQEVGWTMGGSIRSIAGHETRLVALGTDGTVWRSTTGGNSWEVVRTQAGLNDVTWANGLFVAVGNAGAVIVSADGGSWTMGARATKETLRAVAGGPAWVAVGDNGTILESGNALRWRVRQPARPQDFRSVTWTGSIFVATVGSTTRGPILLSPDAINWHVPSHVDSLFGVTGSGSAYSNSTVIVSATAWAGSNPQHAVIYAATDPESWKIVHESYDSYYAAYAFWTGSEFVVLCSHEVLRSPDGTNWTSSTGADFDALSKFFSVTRAGDQFVGITSTSQIYTSNDGFSWSTAGENVGAIPTFTIAWTGKNFLVSGAGQVWSSPDLNRWTALDPPTTVWLEGVAASGDRIVTMGFEGVILTRDRGDL